MHKKGFIQIVEVVIAAIFIAMIIPVFFNIDTKLNWERYDKIDAGNSILSAIYYSGNLSKIFKNSSYILESIEYLKPANIKYALHVDGSPKPSIRVACVCNNEQLNYAKKIFTPVYFNDYWIEFNIDKFEFSYSNISDYDALLFVNYTSFADNENEIVDYLNNGKGIVAVNPGYSDSAFLELFNLTISSEPDANVVYFRDYEPWNNKIEKYFMGFGFDIATVLEIEDNKQQGIWKMWGWDKEVNTTGTQVEIENVGVFSENDYFTLSHPINGLEYEFKIKKIWDDKSGVIIQPMNTTFPFNNFIEIDEQKVKGYNIVGDDPAALTTNNSAVWISDFPEGDDYNTLIKSAMASVVDRFYVFTPENMRENVRIVKFFNMCCDAQETIKITLILWYVL